MSSPESHCLLAFKNKGFVGLKQAKGKK